MNKDKKVQIIYRRVDDLKPYENNPRRNEAAVEPVVESIRACGFLVPIVIDKNDVIVAGHTRLKAAKQLGIEEVPCIEANYLDTEQVTAFRLIDNRTAEFSTWDIAKEAEELAKIVDFDLTVFKFPDLNLDDLQVSDEDFLKDTEIIRDRSPKPVRCPECGHEFVPA